MASYGYNNLGDFNGDYHYHHHSLNSNYNSYSNYPVPVQNSSYNNYQIYGYDSIPSSISYSVSTPINPNYIQYEYPPATSDSSQTQFIVSYSVSHFNDEDDEFDEYDPTPYDGGYNLALTYGNPLPPSVETCYPRSAASASPSISVPPAPISTPAAIIEAEIPSGGQNHIVREEESKPKASGLHNDVVEEKKESNFGGGFGGGELVSYGDEKRVGDQMPYGYGLEAMDICEGLFGYWPCVDRSRRKLKEDCEKEVADCGNWRNENPWEVTSDYLFGNPNPYAQTRGGTGFVDHNNNYGSQNYWG